MNADLAVLLAVCAFAGVMLASFGTLCAGAVRSYSRGELGFEGIRILRWAMLGLITIYVLLAVYRLPHLRERRVLPTPEGPFAEATGPSGGSSKAQMGLARGGPWSGSPGCRRARG